MKSKIDELIFLIPATMMAPALPIGPFVGSAFWNTVTSLTRWSHTAWNREAFAPVRLDKLPAREDRDVPRSLTLFSTCDTDPGHLKFPIAPLSSRYEL